MPSASIHQAGERIEVRGALNSHTARELFEQTPPALTMSPQPSPSPTIIDLAAVREADSAGLALLVHWSNLAQARGGARFANAPAQLRRLAEITGLAEMFD
ncbi:MAG: STAS domain-containing protein [bacterium]